MFGHLSYYANLPAYPFLQGNTFLCCLKGSIPRLTLGIGIHAAVHVRDQRLTCTAIKGLPVTMPGATAAGGVSSTHPTLSLFATMGFQALSIFALPPES